MTREEVETTARELKDFSMEHRSWLIPIASLLVLNVVFFFAFTARSGSKVAALEKDMQESRRSYEAARKELDQNDRMKALGALVDRELQDLYANVLLDYEQNFHNIRLELESILKQVSIGANQITYGKSALPNVKLSQETMSIPLKGDYHTLRKLLNLLEQSDQFLIIDSIQLADSSNQGRELNLNIVLLTFFYDPNTNEEDGRKRPI